MQLSDHLVSVLKNFSTINSSIVLQPGNIQRTIAADKVILAEVETEDTIPQEFGIYDLNQFLGNLSILSKPELDFSENTVVIQDENMKLSYAKCPSNLIVTPPAKELVINKVDASFTLSSVVQQKLLKIAATNSFPHLSIVGKDGDLSIVAHDRKNSKSNSVITRISDYNGKDFISSFKIDNFKLNIDDYDVEVMIDGFAKFVSKTKKLKYFVVFENFK